MPNITLPDGKKLNFEKSITGTEVAEKISKSLGKQALVMSINGELKDLYTLIDQDCSIEIFTAKDPEGLEVIRHETAHIMAMAVQELYPGTQVTIGPVIENGFYYDFARKEPFTSDDLKKIEKHTRSCKRIVENLLQFARKSEMNIEEVNIDKGVQDALDLVRTQFSLQKERGQKYILKVRGQKHSASRLSIGGKPLSINLPPFLDFNVLL